MARRVEAIDDEDDPPKKLTPCLADNEAFFTRPRTDETEGA
ncbi:hypothetical protein [Mycobacterium heidelbergense]|nr:hypothetical protein [Mycobacterium heidelbergense]